VAAVYRLILASSSPYRRALLSRLGVPFEVASAHGVDEAAVKAARLQPEALARRLALEKARAVSAAVPGAVVIGADQVAALEPDAAGAPVTFLDKPGTEARAVEQLLSVGGRTIRLVSAVALLDGTSGREAVEASEHRIRFRSLTRAQIEDYVRRERPLDCAGSFKIEGLGVALMAAIEGDDPTGVEGLPLLRLTRMLEAFGIPVLAGLGVAGARAAPSPSSPEVPAK